MSACTTHSVMRAHGAAVRAQPLQSHIEIGPGVIMPRVGLGTFRARGSDAVAAITAALCAGFRHIDTASIYKNYAEISEALQLSGVPRGDVFITSKVSPQGEAKARASVEACSAAFGAPRHDVWHMRQQLASSLYNNLSHWLAHMFVGDGGHIRGPSA